MSDLTPTVTLVDNTPRVSSLDIAERFGKRHDDVLKAIKRIVVDLDESFRDRNFAETFADVPGPNGAVRQSPMYSLTRDAFSLVAMGFTGKAALAWKVRYIEAFNAMEKELVKRLAPKRGRKALPQAPAYPRFTPRTTMEEIESRITALHSHFNKERYAIYVDLLNQFCNTYTPRVVPADVVCSSVSDAIFNLISECVTSAGDTPPKSNNPCTFVRQVRDMLESVRA